MQQGAPDRVLQADGAGDVSSVCLVCEGVLAAASESGAVQLWDVRSGGVLRVLEGHASEVWEVCMAADGVLASASEDGTCRLWRAASGECLHVLSHNHPAREYLVSCAGVASSPAASSASSAAAAAAAALVATASSGRVRLWRVTDGALVHDLPTAAGDSVNCVAGAGVGVVASGCDSGAVRMWCALGGTCLRTIGVAGPVDSLRAVPCARGSGGTLLAVAFGGGEYAATGELGLYDASSGVRRRALLPGGHRAPALGGIVCAVGADALACSGGGRMRLWRASSGELLQELAQHGDDFTGVCVVAPGLLAAGQACCVRLMAFEPVDDEEEAGVTAVPVAEAVVAVAAAAPPAAPAAEVAPAAAAAAASGEPAPASGTVLLTVLLTADERGVHLEPAGGAATAAAAVSSSSSSSSSSSDDEGD